MNLCDNSRPTLELSLSDQLFPFSANLGQELVFGSKSLSRIGSIAQKMHVDKILLITDQGICQAGHLETVKSSLCDSDIESVVFDKVQENPSSYSVEETAKTVSGELFDLIVAIGGGSVMDTAKAVNFLLTNGGRIKDYKGYGKAHNPMLPSIGVPTTAGTGSEAQSYAVVTCSSDNIKIACGDSKARFNTVILDPHLLETVPRDVVASTTLDALSHAVESLVSRNSHPISRMYSCWSWKLLEKSCEKVAKRGNQRDLGQMIIGSYLAGMAVELSMLGAAHACANPLTSRYPIRHGVAVSLILPQVIIFNGRKVSSRYQLLEGVDSNFPVETLATRLETLRMHFGLPKSLSELGVSMSSIAEMAEEAEGQWTGQFNPIPLTAEAAVGIYKASL